jgi:high-affinity K+ transport system ATPase subunit B
MNTAVLIIVFVVALVFSLGFLLLVLTLIPAIQQFKSMMLDLEKTSVEVRDLARELKRVSAMAEDRLEKVDMVLAKSGRTVENAGEVLHFISQNVFRRSAGLLAFLPAIKIGWNLIKKIKGGK